MAKYKVKNTTILHNGKAYGDGAVIELSDADADKLTKYLVLVKDKTVVTPQKTENKTQVKTQTPPATQVNNEQNNGGNNDGK